MTETPPPLDHYRSSGRPFNSCQEVVVVGWVLAPTRNAHGQPQIHVGACTHAQRARTTANSRGCKHPPYYRLCISALSHMIPNAALQATHRLVACPLGKWYHRWQTSLARQSHLEPHYEISSANRTIRPAGLLFCLARLHNPPNRIKSSCTWPPAATTPGRAGCPRQMPKRRTAHFPPWFARVTCSANCEEKVTGWDAAP